MALELQMPSHENPRTDLAIDPLDVSSPNAAWSRRDFLQMAGAAGALAVAPKAWAASSAPASDAPVVFWTSESLLPGDMAMALGGGLSVVKEVKSWRLEDGPVGVPGMSSSTPASATMARTVQGNERSIKFEVSPAWEPGVFAFRPADGAVKLINQPLVWFVQPTLLLPGLSDNELAPGGEFQVIGKDFLLPDESGKALVALRGKGGAWKVLGTTKAERYSIQAVLPADVAPGHYEMSVHNGFGGAAGWSAPLAIGIKQPVLWPQKTWNVRDFGALGDDVHDDTDAIRKALAEAEKNGGGVISFPFGTYRLSDYIVIPQKTVLRGEMRDISILKWPEDQPLTSADMTLAAIYTASEFGIHDLTLIARKVRNIVLDLSTQNGHYSDLPSEVMKYIRPWTQYRDVFIRRVRFQHWLAASRPEQHVTDEKLLKLIWSGDGAVNFKNAACTNFEVSDCVFQGGQNQFMGLQNGRVTGNSFSNDMNYCWTVLGGGARRLVVMNNDIHASSSFGFGSISIQYVYSAHNVSNNFVRGEREAMTLDVSSMPGARAVAEYWGTPTSVTNEPGKVTLTFAPASAPANLDGFRTGFTPGAFRGGTAFVHAFDGGAGGGQRRKILDNTSDTVTLDEPWKTVPETTPRRLYLELAPRKNENAGITPAWVGDIAEVQPQSLKGTGAKWVPDEFVGYAALVFTGRGAGQYRLVTANSETEVKVDRPWDVMPERGDAIGIWAVVRHMIVYKCEAYDTSAFAQLYGSGYDYIIDSCITHRNQGMWGQMGWFVQFNRNQIEVGYSYHKGIGPHGPTPEGNVPYGIVGLNGGELRLTKFGQVQYPEIPAGTPIMVDKLVGRAIPGGLATVLRRNHLKWNERIVLGSAANPSKPVRFIDAVIDGNSIEHSAVGIQLGGDVDNVVTSRNRFSDVKEAYSVVKMQGVTILDAKIR
jgi:hypothetical protein